MELSFFTFKEDCFVALFFRLSFRQGYIFCRGGVSPPFGISCCELVLGEATSPLQLACVIHSGPLSAGGRGNNTLRQGYVKICEILLS